MVRVFADGPTEGPYVFLDVGHWTDLVDSLSTLAMRLAVEERAL